MSISIQNVSRDFRSLWALREINAEIAAGSTVAVLGANGAGKSTLLRLIAGWIPPAEGRIQIQGHTMRINSMSVRRRLMLLDEPRSGEASIIEMIGQAISDYQVDRPELANEVAEWFEKLDLVGNYGKSANAVSKVFSTDVEASSEASTDASTPSKSTPADSVSPTENS